MHDLNAFITLTYNDKNLPKVQAIKTIKTKKHNLFKKKHCKKFREKYKWPSELQGVEIPTLVKEHLQLFLKKLRRKLEREIIKRFKSSMTHWSLLSKTEKKDLVKNEYKKQAIRYYGVGEYGDRTKRPHIHIIIFNYWPLDAKVHPEENGHKLYTSETLEKIWSYGECKIGLVNFDTASYTARYVTQKVTGEDAIDHYNGKVAEFALMSRKPGIGELWWKEYKKQTMAFDEIVVNGIKQKPPRYYTELLRKENTLEHFKLRMDRMKVEEIKTDRRLSQIDYAKEKKLGFFKKIKI